MLLCQWIIQGDAAFGNYRNAFITRQPRRTRHFWYITSMQSEFAPLLHSGRQLRSRGPSPSPSSWKLNSFLRTCGLSPPRPLQAGFRLNFRVIEGSIIHSVTKVWTGRPIRRLIRGPFFKNWHVTRLTGTVHLFVGWLWVCDSGESETWPCCCAISGNRKTEFPACSGQCF